MNSDCSWFDLTTWESIYQIFDWEEVGHDTNEMANKWDASMALTIIHLCEGLPVRLYCLECWLFKILMAPLAIEKWSCYTFTTLKTSLICLFLQDILQKCEQNCSLHIHNWIKLIKVDLCFNSLSGSGITLCESVTFQNKKKLFLGERLKVLQVLKEILQIDQSLKHHATE